MNAFDESTCDVVAAPVSTDLKTAIRCPQCCHAQSLCKKDLTVTLELPDFGRAPRKIPVRI
jgi:hypothetical protein